MNGLTDTTGRPLPPIEAPSSETLRALGDMAFLALRSPRHATMTLADFRRSIEPPLMLGQYRIIRIDGVPRGMFTWALMTRAAERDYVHGAPLAATDWRSGDRLWLIDLIAPYKGMTASMVRWIMQPGNFAEREFFFRRVTQGNRTRRIVHIDFSRPDDKARVLTEADFA